tara:strand:+ start:686 stop:916 length:231 start_codon:yes stop_codon:yes gene_type:complete
LKVDINDILRDDFQDIIVTRELKRVHGYMEEYSERYKQKDHGFVAIFSTDKDEDIAQIETLREALEVVLQYYGEEV